MASKSLLERRSRTVDVVIVVVAITVVSLPWMVLLFGGISPITLTSEAIAYRFFHPFRIQAGEPGPIFLPQGQTLGLFHHLLVAIDRISTHDATKFLRVWFDVFVFATNGLLSILLLIGLWMLRSRKPILGVTIAALLFIVYGCRSGIFAIIDPDYLGFELASTLIVIGLSVRWRRSQPKCRLCAIIGLGVMAGMMAGLKFPLAATSLLAAVPLFASPGLRWGRRISEVVVFGFVSIAAFVAVLYAYYLGRASALPVHFRMLAEFVSNPGTEDRFWASLFSPHSPAANPGADYGYARVALVVWLSVSLLALVALGIAWNRRLAVVLAVSITLALLHLRGLIQRPAGTTLWEICVFLMGATICTLLELPDGALARCTCMSVTVVLALVAAICGPTRFRQMIPFHRLQSVSDAIWESHNELMAAPPPHIFIFLDPSHVAGTVGEVLLKGSQDFPTPRLDSGMEALRSLSGDIQMLTSTDGVHAGDSVLLVEAPGERFPELEKARSVKSWNLQLFPWWPRKIVLYRPLSSKTIP